MEDNILTRKEQRAAAQRRVDAFGKKMRTALSSLSRGNEGLMLLRWLMYECKFLSPLSKETIEGVNKDVLIENEALRRLYLRLRVHMDRETIIKIEVPEHKKEGKTDGEK